MKITSFELEIRSSSKNLSTSKNLQGPASRSKHKAVDGLRFVTEIGKDFRGKEALKQQKTETHRVMNCKKLPTDSKASSSNEVMEILPANFPGRKVCINSYKGKQALEARRIKQLSERLKILEEETETMKNEFFEHVEERKELATEICQLFQTIQYCLQVENQVNGERPCDGSSIANLVKKAGSEVVLCQFASPCIASTIS